jgi:hypothetical protein
MIYLPLLPLLTKVTPDDVRHLPISSLIKSSFLNVQKTRFNRILHFRHFFEAPVHFMPIFRNRSKPHTLPKFRKRYYQTEEDILQPVPAVLELDASSLWGSVPPTVPTTFTVPLSDMDRTETVARRTLLALNSCEWFQASLIKSDNILSDDNSTQDEFNDAVLFSRRIKESIGMCLETIASNQTLLLSSLLLQKRDSLLEGHAGAIHPGLVQFLRAQPLLNSTAIFAKEMQEANKNDRTFRTMSDALSTMSKSTSGNKSSFAGQRGASARGAVNTRANARARGAPLVCVHTLPVTE